MPLDQPCRLTFDIAIKLADLEIWAPEPHSCSSPDLSWLGRLELGRRFLVPRRCGGAEEAKRREEFCGNRELFTGGSAALCRLDWPTVAVSAWLWCRPTLLAHRKA